MVVPSELKPATGDVQEGPLISITDNALDSHVSSDITINPCIDMYIVRNDLETVTKTFIHPVELQGNKGITSIIGGLFDEGAFVNSICSKKLAPLQRTLGAPTPSSKILRMANRGRVSSEGHWCRDVSLGGKTVKACFENFPSGSGWSLLFGKPLLKQFSPIHDYVTDTIMIPSNGKWTTLVNKCDDNLTVTVTCRENIDMVKGDVVSPLRQVLHLILAETEHVDKQCSNEPPINTIADVVINSKGKSGRRNRQNRQSLQQWWNSIWTISDADNNPVKPQGDLQLEININSDNSLFTQTSDLHNP